MINLLRNRHESADKGLTPPHKGEGNHPSMFDRVS